MVDLRHRLIAGITALAVLGTLTPQVAAQPAPPRGEVTIYRDAKGVPHIEGATSAAVMYGLGYSQAQDRLAQLEMNRRTKKGTRAEILGPRMVEADKLARNEVLSDAELLRMYATLPAEHQAMLQGFVDGLNRHIDEVLADPERKLPYEFKSWGVLPARWTLADYLSHIAAPHGNTYELQNLAFLNAMVARYGPEVGRRIFDDVVPISDPDTPLIIPPGEDLAPAGPVPKGAPYPPAAALTTAMSALREAPRRAEPVVGASRCLVIGPQKSASGRPLLMEATSDGPESHLYGGGFDTVGFSHTGWGPPLMGRSLKHGWLMTSGHAETTDTYAEKLNPADRHQYWFKGEWRRMEVRAETIKVKGAEPVAYEVAWTVHGPVIKWDVSNGVAYTQRNNERGHELDTWVGVVEMARARNLAEFQSKGVARVAWNLGVCYADEAGNIGFWEAGKLPKRPATADSRLPMPGTGEYEWEGFHTAKEMPRMINPKQGYIHTWNGKAAAWLPEGDDARIGKTYRTWLGDKLASAGKGMTLLDMREINRKIWNAEGARDRAQTSPDFFAAPLRAAISRSSDPEVKQALELMLSFNGMYEDLDGDGRYDNPGGTLWRAWLETAPDVIFSPHVGEWWWKVDDDRYHQYKTSLLLRAVQGKDAGLPLQFDYFQGRDRDAVIAQTVRATIDKLKPAYPSQAMTAWRAPVFWKYFDAGRFDPSKPSLPGEDMFRRTASVLGLAPAMVKHHGGEGWAGMMELNPKDRAIFSVVEAGGQSLFIDQQGRGNPHLSDQLRMHANNEFKRIDMSIETIKRDAVSTTKLKF